MTFHPIQRIFADFQRICQVLPPRLKKAVGGVLTVVLLQTLLEVLAILAISGLALSVTAPERLQSHFIVKKIVEFVPLLQGLMEDERNFSTGVAIATAILMAAKNGLGALVNFMSGRLGEKIALFAGDTIFHHFLYSPYVQHLSGNSQSMFQAMSWRTDLGRMTVQMLAVYSYAAISLALCLMLIFFTPGIVLALLGIIGFLAVLIYSRLKKSIDAAGKSSAEWRRQENTTCMNSMNGIREILIYGQQKPFFQNFQAACRNSVHDRAFLTMAPTIPTWVLETMGFLGLAATVWVMTSILDAPMANITSVLTIIMLVCWRILPLLNRTLGAMVIVRSTRHAAMDCLTKVEEALGHPTSPPALPEHNFIIHADICLKNVTFSYPAADSPCLSNVSFVIPKGSTLGIVGRSGAGKSSLASILCGLVEPDTGALLIDNKRLTPEKRAAYCKQIGYVPQNPYILSGTIAENVAFSEWGKPWDNARVLQACRMAELDIAFNRGLDCKLGQGGLGLSGGQAQRLAIARALYANPAVLILDEATSALDTGVESAIMQTIFSLPRSITTIIIAHRLSTVESCDRIVWIEKGQVHLKGETTSTLAAYKDFLANHFND